MVALASSQAVERSTDRLIDRVAALVEKADLRLADTQKEREAIFRLRYHAYLREGAITPNDTGSFSDPLDQQPNALIFGVYIDDALASSLRLHISTPEYPNLPAMNVFSDLLGPELETGQVIVDPTRFVADRDLSRVHPELCYVTTRLAWMASEYFQAKYLLATVRTEHQAFYRRTFGHKVVCEARHYPSLTKPISMMALDYRPNRERVLARYPFFRSTFFERRMLFSSFPQQQMPLPLPKAA